VRGADDEQFVSFALGLGMGLGADGGVKQDFILKWPCKKYSNIEILSQEEYYRNMLISFACFGSIPCITTLFNSTKSKWFKLFKIDHAG
jgi:hypothetical protein